MKFLIALSIAFTILATFVLAIPISTLATSGGNNNNSHQSNNRNDNHRSNDRRDYRNDRSVTICHKGNTITVDKSSLPAHIGHGDSVGECPPANVPEFGMIPGVLAALSSGGAFLYMKKRYNK